MRFASSVGTTPARPQNGTSADAGGPMPQAVASLQAGARMLRARVLQGSCCQLLPCHELPLQFCSWRSPRRGHHANGGRVERARHRGTTANARPKAGKGNQGRGEAGGDETGGPQCGALGRARRAEERRNERGGGRRNDSRAAERGGRQGERDREGGSAETERERSGNAEAMLKSEHYREGKGTAKDNKRRAHGGRREQQRRDDAEARRGAVARHEWRRGAKHVGGDETERTDDTRQMGGTCAAGEPRREELGDGIGVEKRRGGGGG